MPIADEIEAFASLGDGALLVLPAAGRRGRGLTGTLRGARYDPGTGAWEDVGGPTIRWDAHIELVGLHDGGALVLTNTGDRLPVHARSPARDLAGKLLERRLSPAVVELEDGRVLVAGGARGDRALSSVELLDPRTGTSTEGREMPVARVGGVAVRLQDGSVLLMAGAPRPSGFDGWTGSDRVVNRVLRWVP